MPAYDIILADPPWHYYGSATKNAAAGKHYDLMTQADICALPVADICAENAVCFIWATGPKLPEALAVMAAWGFHYRGIAFNWIKTRKDGKPIGAQGIPPTVTKPTSEIVIVGTTCKRGRPIPLLDFAVPQVILAPRGKHSAKPDDVHESIERLFGPRPRIELFARARREAWDAWGNEVDTPDLPLLPSQWPKPR